MTVALAILISVLIVLIISAHCYSWTRIWRGELINWFLAMQAARAISWIIDAIVKSN